MTDVDPHALLERARAHLDAFELEPALALAAQARQHEGRTIAQDLLLCQALLGLERYGEARQVARDLVEHGGDRARPRALLARARVTRRSSPYIDDALEAALEAAELASKRPGELADTAAAAHLEAARVFAFKRCPKLARDHLDRARAIAGDDDAQVLWHAGRVELHFDDRPAAKACFEAIEPTDRRAALLRLGSLAELEYVMGEFDAAHAHLDAIGEEPSGALWLMRLRAEVLSAQRRWEEAAECLGRAVAASPTADTAPRTRYGRAVCLYHTGDLDGAADELTELLETAGEEGHWGRWGRRMLDLVEHPEAPHRPKKRLVEFPSVSQLRDHCGPASCELYLRYFGLSADQIEIAREIKSEGGGTPVYRMRRYLEEAGFVTRRVEADLPRLKALIDAGLPVIMEESYSTSSHVAVAIGYDECRELLEVQDPMTHRIRETHYEDLTRLRNLSNHGALVAAPRDRDDLVAALDEAGAIECEYIALVDEAWKAYDEGEPERGDELADRSIELHREYEMAWLYRFRRSRERWSEEPDADKKAEAKVALHQVLGEIASLWPDDEWPQQLVGQVYYFVEERYGEALGAFERARDLDPDDPYNWSMIADCHLRFGDDERAYEALIEALGRDPSHVRANENLADLARKRGQRIYAWQLNDAARELHPDNYYNHAVHGQLLEADGEDEAALGAYERALELDAERDWVVLRRARLLASMGRGDDAVRALEALLERRDDLDTLIDFADLCYRLRRWERAIELCDRLLERDPEVAAGYSIKGAATARLGELEAGFELLDRALEVRPLYAWVHTERGKLLLEAGRKVEAIGAFAAALGLSKSSASAELALGNALAEAGYQREALRHLRAAAVTGELSETELARIGALMVESGHGDPDALFKEVESRRPRDLAVLRAHARTMLEVLWAPSAGYRVLRQIEGLDAGDPYALASRGQDLMWERAETEAEGEALLRRAIELEPEQGYARRALGDALVSLGRHREALEVLEPQGPSFRDEQLRVMAHLGLEEESEAAAVAARFRERWGEEGRPCVGALRLEYEIAKARGDFAAALEIAEVVSRESYERDDDGRLDRWEEERFECMVRLGELERAKRFGLAQASRAESMGRLAFAAYKADRWELATDLAARALRLDARESLALATTARSLELSGDVAGAVRTWNQLGEVDGGWHIWQEQLARMALSEGDLEVAARAAEDAVASGSMCPWAWAMRAQVRFLSGDSEGASEDLARTRRLASPRSRREEHRDVWGLLAGLEGDLEAAAAHFAAYLEGPGVSELDQKRVARLKQALG